MEVCGSFGFLGDGELQWRDVRLQVSYKLRFKTDVIVIGKFLGSAAITQFSIGGRLVDYASEVVSSLAQIFLPMSSQSDAKGDLKQLRKILLRKTEPALSSSFRSRPSSSFWANPSSRLGWAAGMSRAAIRSCW